eukprot:1917432-Pleurochrysis_carterae.AAC.1
MRWQAHACTHKHTHVHGDTCFNGAGSSSFFFSCERVHWLVLLLSNHGTLHDHLDRRLHLVSARLFCLSTALTVDAATISVAINNTGITIMAMARTLDPCSYRH